MSRVFKAFFADEGGAVVIEYALILSFIAMVIVAALTVVGVNLGSIFQTIATGFK